MGKITCSVEECDKPVFGRGWCHMHWNRWRRHGDPLATLRHGGKSAPEYRPWKSMRERCNNRHCAAYPNYGGRGISVCREWDDFPTFLRDVGPRPSPGHSIDRIDVNGNYEPGNCRWATASEQARNKRNTVLLTHAGRTQTVIEWANELGLNRYTVWWRVRHGWPVEKALS